MMLDIWKIDVLYEARKVRQTETKLADTFAIKYRIMYAVLLPIPLTVVKMTTVYRQGIS